MLEVTGNYTVYVIQSGFDINCQCLIIKGGDKSVCLTASVLDEYNPGISLESYVPGWREGHPVFATSACSYSKSLYQYSPGGFTSVGKIVLCCMYADVIVLIRRDKCFMTKNFIHT